MSSFDPDFEYFRQASAYRNTVTDHEPKFRAFRAFVLDSSPAEDFSAPFVVQFVCHPNFEAHRKSIIYYELVGSSFEERPTLPAGYCRANSFKNYKSSGGHPNGLFYELNLYTSDGSSHHHTSRVTGNRFARDGSHDQQHGTTKGPHWRE